MAEKEYNVSWPGWNVVGIIGYGSYGRVYEIERDVFGHTEKAALKVISIPQNSGEVEELYNDGYDSESITERFKSHLKEIVREYSLMSEIKGHTNIVYCDDLRYVQHDDGMGWDIYIKMELLTPLPKNLSNGFSEEFVVKLGLDMCNALILCKSKNIVHRDIKPQNIFESEDGNFKLGDFGIAKTAERTTSGTKTGTYKYMAPEVYNNLPYGHAADIYSLGMVLYWLLNERRTPFLPLPPQVPTATEENRARNSRFAGIPIPAPLHGSDALKQIVLKACAFCPEERYKSATEMRKDLLALAGDGTNIAQSQHIRSSAEEKQKMRIPVTDTNETVGNFGSDQKVKTPSEETVGVFAGKSTAESPENRKRKLPPTLLGVALCAVVIIAVATALGNSLFQNNSTRMPQENFETGVTATVSTKDPVEIAYQNVVSYCAGLEASGDYSKVVHYIKEYVDHNNQDKRYADLLAKYEKMLKESILKTAADYAANKQYRLAIYTLDEAWKQYDDQEFFDCAATYRKDFGIENTEYFSAGKFNTMLIRDHVAEIVGDDSNGELKADDWPNIIAVGAGDRHVIGLKADGAVVAAGENIYGQCDVEDWRDVVAISAGDVHTVALTKSGTVIATGYNQQNQCQVEKLMYAAGESKIVSVAAGYHHTLALLEDGTVVACGSESVYKGCCDVYDWSDIASIYAGTSFSAGLKSDGTVVATGINRAGGNNVSSAWDLSGWTDIVNLAAGDYYLVGLKSDGTVLFAGSLDEIDGKAANEMSAWQNIVQISAGHDHVIALTANGKVLCAGKDDYGQCDFNETTINYSDSQIQPFTSLVNLEKISDTNSEESRGRDVLVGASTRHEGVEIDDAIRFWVVKGSGYTNTESIELYLASSYTTLSGWAFAGDESGDNTNMTLRFYGDGKFLDEITDIEKGKNLYPEIDVAGVNILKIECTTEKNAHGYCYIQATVEC